MDPALAGTPAKSIVFQDGLGERRRMADVSGADTIELLCLRGELTAIPAFEFALRERASRLTNFRNACFGRVRSVDRLSDPPSTLAVVSDSIKGVRLSNLLAASERRPLTLDINASLHLLRQLVAAVAMLHETARDVAHGAIGPERVIVTPNARIVVVEYVLGAALEQLHFSHERYWRELRIALPASPGLPRFDHRGDVTQIGAVALALVLGRLLHEDEYPARVADVLASAQAMTSNGEREPLPEPLRAWIRRALQLDRRNSFASAIEARDELDRVLSGDEEEESVAVEAEPVRETPAAVTLPPPVAETPVAPPTPTFGSRFEAPKADAPSARFEAAPKVESTSRFGFTSAPEPTSTFQTAAKTDATTKFEFPTPKVEAFAPKPEPVKPEPFKAESFKVEPPKVETAKFDAPKVEPVKAEPARVELKADPKPEPPKFELPKPEPVKAEPVKSEPSRTFGFEAPSKPTVPTAPAFDLLDRTETTSTDEIEAEDDHDVETSTQNARPWNRIAAIAAVVVVLAAAGIYGGKRLLSSTPAAAPTGTLSISSNPAGAQVAVDGQVHGVTPLTVTLKAGSHVIELRGAGEPRAVPVTIVAGTSASQYFELPKADTAFGQLQIRTEPAGAQVTVDGIPRGKAPVLVESLAAGDHAVVLQSESATVKQSVTVEAGQVASLVVPLVTAEPVPSSGWISVSAPVELQLFENKRLLGTSQSDRVMVSAGKHEIEMVNDTLGFRATKTVQVSAGKTAPLKLEWPKGTIAINAVPWAEVYIDGEKIGETPIGNLQLAIGPHELVFRHPELGEQTYATTVSLKAPARVSVDLRKK